MDLRQQILRVAEEIKPLLKPLPFKATRNSYAHIYGLVKDLCGVSYDQADPLKVQAILKAVQIDPNASSATIFKQAKQIYKQSKQAALVDTHQ